MIGLRWQVLCSRLSVEKERWHLTTGAGDEVSFRQVLSLWKDDEAFRAFWNESLRSVPFDAYCWECPPLSTRNVTWPFECVFVSSPLMDALPPDPGSFAEYFSADCRVVAFENLGRDALLVAPCPGTPGTPGTQFAHLARFVATASAEQSSALWSRVGEAVESRLGDRPLWLSTAGLGVSWLHVRLDSRPKYYRHAPYKSVIAAST